MNSIGLLYLLRQPKHPPLRTLAGLVMISIVSFFHDLKKKTSLHQPKPLLPADLGWISVLNAIPYCLWWLVIIETVSVASEETQDTTRSIPRGLVWGQLTLIGLIKPTKGPKARLPNPWGPPAKGIATDSSDKARTQIR